VLFSLLTLALFVALVEAALALAGLGERGDRQSLSRGFSPTARYLVPDGQRPGWWVTQMYGGEEPEVVIPPKRKAVRVMMFGGSNVAGFQTEHLDQALDRAFPSPGFEVINLGRAGYGSERELILLRQALELRPDIVLIYVGHNEFVEAGFALELSQATWRTPLATRIVDGLLGLRSVCMTADLLEGRAEATRGPPLPEARRPRSKVFRDLTPDSTQTFYDVYRSNLTAMVDACRAAGVRVLLATVVSNVFDPPYGYAPPADWSDARRKELSRARWRMEEQMPRSVFGGLIPDSSNPFNPHLRPTDWGQNLSGTSLEERLARPEPPPEPPRSRPHTGALAKAPFWAEPELWTDTVFEVLSIFDRVHARQITDDERAALRRAVTAGEEALALCPDDPRTLYHLGLCVYVLGEDDTRAAQLLQQASATDRAPTKGNDVTNGIVRALAGERAGDAGLRFVDIDELFRARCPQRLPGFELFLDNCHLHKAARLILIEDFVPALVELGRGVVAERGP